ncbi:hypothetical protein EH223_17410 [candidate division KSB1 bacterium]|nr:MAG: hypothetical protein EH223_17410 [candidate division KSB1 bacterium]
MQLEDIVTYLSLQVLIGNDLAKDVICGYIGDIRSDVRTTSPKASLWDHKRTDENIDVAGILYILGLCGTVT